MHTPIHCNLLRTDGQPLGTFAEVRQTIRQIFPEVKFHWTQSGPEQLRRLPGEGAYTPDVLRKYFEQLPSQMEGLGSGPRYLIAFNFGHEEPVTGVRVTLFGKNRKVLERLDALQTEIGAEFQSN